MKIAPKPPTTTHRIDWEPPSYASVRKGENSSAQKNAQRVHEAEQAQRKSVTKWRTL